MPDGLDTTGDGSIAYILKGFPRLSEIFIASEIARLEDQGTRIELIVLKPPAEAARHPVVQRIVARPHHLPGTEWTRGIPAWRWLRAHFGDFRPALLRVARRRPLRLVRAAGRALAQAVRARRRPLSWPRKVYLKEFLQAVGVADRILQAGDVRHIHAHFCHGATTVAWFASAMTGLPFSFTAHAKDIYEPSLNPAGLLRRKLLAARFAVTCTEANREHMAAIAPEARVHRVYHGLNADFSRLLNGYRAEPPRGEPLRVLAVGRLVEKKGFDILIRALALLDERGLQVTTRLVGETGPARETVERLIAEHGLGDRVEIVGAMDQAGLYREYTATDLFCLPCRVLESGDRDGIPNVLMEAMACGVPVVATDVSGIPELVAHEENGLLVAPESPDAAADAIARLAGDPSLYSRLSDAAARTIRADFDGDRLAADLRELLESAR